jgi:hypothetical protein
MSLSQDLMAAEAQIDERVVSGMPIGQSDAASLCAFLRACAVEAIELEVSARHPVIALPEAVASVVG